MSLRVQDIDGTCLPVAAAAVWRPLSERAVTALADALDGRPCPCCSPGR
ncbi:hypothetical protein [Streptomyces sp. CB01881]|nr:hypothetical protein [Streptomyces sp. CB01881]